MFSSLIGDESLFNFHTSTTFDKLCALACVVPILLIGQIAVLSIYRLYFHPLSKYPGPRLAAITQAYRHWYMLRGTEEKHSLELHNKYGPVVRLGPDYLMYIDEKAWKDIYGHRIGDKKPTRKFLTFADRYLGHSSIITAETEEDHARLRRIFSHAFSEQSMRKQEPMLQHYVDLLVNRLRRASASSVDAKVNILQYFNFTTFDFISDLTFSEPLGLLENDAYTPYVTRIFNMIKAQSLFFVATQYPLLSSLLSIITPTKIKEGLKEHHRFVEERVDRRIEKGCDRPDIWNLVMNQKDDRALTTKEMYTNADVFMLAGTESVAACLSGMIYHLLRTPKALKKLRDELDTAFPPGQGINATKLAQLDYLRACITESLRIYPPAPLSLLRIIPPEGALVVDRWVPGYTKVGICHYAAYHSETNFAVPEEYHPERWLSDTQDPRFTHDKKRVHEPFQFGPRNCIGQNLAWMELRMIAANVFINFDIELCAESEEWLDQKVFSLWEKGPLVVKFRERLSSLARTRQ